MSGKERKYLDDESVKKNLDRFNNDRDNFINDSSYLDNLGIGYKSNNSYKKDKGVIKSGIIKEKISDDDNRIIKKKSSYVYVPIVLSVLIIIYYYINSIGFDSIGTAIGLSFLIGIVYTFSDAFAESIAVCVFIWFFYIMWLLVKKILLRDGKSCEIKSLFICVCLIIIFLSLVTILDKFY